MSEEYNDIDELLQIGQNRGPKLLFGSEFRFDSESDFDVMSSNSFLIKDNNTDYYSKMMYQPTSLEQERGSQTSTMLRENEQGGSDDDYESTMDIGKRRLEGERRAPVGAG
jgi:hypothetical protein